MGSARTAPTAAPAAPIATLSSVWQKKADFRNFDFSFYGMESETN
jgi:hypothetical protein